jgi:enoyl-CoA hydratase/carnithine racemase
MLVNLKIRDQNRVRTLTLNRPDALNAFDDSLYQATGAAFRAAADDPEVSVVLMTGEGKAFSAGADLAEMQTYLADPSQFEGEYGAGFRSLIAALTVFPKPLICAVNGLGIGIGTTILGYADLVFMSTAAKLKCPFTSLGVAPEASSSYLLPRLIGRQNAAWLLLSSEWVGAAEAKEMGLVWKVCAPEALLPEARRHAETLASRSLASLMAVKATMTAPLAAGIAAARRREDACYAELMGSAANAEALADFERRR